MSIKHVRNGVGVWEIRSLPGGGTRTRLVEDYSGMWRRSATGKGRIRKPPKRLSASAAAYAKAEERHQAELKRRAKTSSPTVIKAARARKAMRHSYTAAERDEMARKGITMLDGSHRITNAAELRRTIRLASEPGASRDALRRHCIKRAPGMGLSNLIPQSWNGDGTLR